VFDRIREKHKEVSPTGEDLPENFTDVDVELEAKVCVKSVRVWACVCVCFCVVKSVWLCQRVASTCAHPGTLAEHCTRISSTLAQ
jgi:hypothetical protein